MNENKSNLVKTIKLEDDVHARLAKYGTSIGETFQDVIVRLMDFWDAGHKK